MSFKQSEEESLKDFVKTYHRVILNLSAFNYLQALRGQKESKDRVVHGTINSYSAAYEQVKIDIRIEEEKAAKVRGELLEEIKRWERSAKSGNKIPVSKNNKKL